MKKFISLILVVLIFIFTFFAIKFGGDTSISMEQIINISSASTNTKVIVFDLRLPRIIMAILIGMMLASSGVVVQTVFQNQLADPYIIGIAASATFGSVIAFVLKMPDFMYGVIAFIMSLISTFTIFKMSKKGNSVNISTLLIIGIAVSSFLSSLTTFAMYLIGEDSFKIIMWLMGNLGEATWLKIGYLILPLGISMTYFYINRNNLDALLSGDEEAHSLGVDVSKLKSRMLVSAALIVAFSVVFSGMIGFVGLIIPHITRMITGPSNSKLIPNAALLGGLFLLICDTIGRVILYPLEIPISVITAFFGAPFFLYLALKTKKGM